MADDNTVNGMKKGNPVVTTKRKPKEYVVPEGAPTSKPNPVIKSRQTHIKHNPHTYAIPNSSYRPKTNPLEEQIDRFQRSEFGREMGYSDSELASIIKENPVTAKELFVKMKDNDRYGGAELRSLGGASEYYEQEHESVVSYHNLGTTSNPLDIMAGRMSGKDVTGLHSFVKHAERARKIMSSGVGMNVYSEDPAEVIAYGAREKGIDLGGLVGRLRSSEAFKFSDVREVAGVRNNTQAMTVFKAMTGDDLSQQQVDKADLITPQMYKDASSDKFIQDAVKVSSAFKAITDYYINPLELSKDTGLGENADLESTRRRVQNYLERELPPQVTNQAIHLAQGGKGAWADALPHPDVVAAHLSKSKFGSKYAPYLRTAAGVDELSSLGVSPDEILKASDFKEELKTIQRAFKASNEGGLKHTFDPDMRSNVHELDELSKMGNDNFATFVTGTEQARFIDSRSEERTESFQPYIESDATRVLDNIYGALGIQLEGLEGESNQTSKEEKALVREAIAQFGEEGQAMFTNMDPWFEGTISNSFARDWDTSKVDYTSIAGKPSTSSAGHSSPLDPVNQGPKPWPSIKPPNYSPNYSSTGASAGTYFNNGERFVDLRTAKEYLQGTPKDIEANKRKQEAFFDANPNLTFLSNDDDKHEAGSVWHQKRQGLLSSSTIPSLSNPKKSGAAIKGLFKDALKSDEEKFFKPDPTDFNINFSAGDALEEQGIGWYKANVDDSIFEPGMLKSSDPAKRGQSTTPDAMTSDGKKVVEFKSAQYLSDPYADPSTQEGRNQRQQWQTYYAQLQHQMYMTGAKSGDIVQMMKDPLNPHLPDGGKFTSDNIQRKTFDRDDDYIKRMSPVWEQLGQSANALSGLDPSIQKNLAKAVSEGNIDSYEKLSKKHGFDSDGSIRGALFGEGAGGAGSSRRGGGSGGGGGGGIFSGIAGANRPGSQSIIRGALSGSPWGRAVNIATGIAEALYDTTMDANDFSVGVAASSRGAGYGNEDMFRNARDSMQRNRFVSAQDAIRDITTLSTASGGLHTGHTGEAVNIVTATRGAVSFEDIYNLNPEDEDAMANLVSKAESSMRANGYNDFAISAMMKKAGLSSGLSVGGKTMEGREAFNDAAVLMSTSVETAKLELISATGDAGDSIVAAIDRIHAFLTSDENSVRDAVEATRQLQIEGGIDADGNVVKPNSYKKPLPISTMGYERPTSLGYTRGFNKTAIEEKNRKLREKREQEKADKADIEARKAIYDEYGMLLRPQLPKVSEQSLVPEPDDDITALMNAVAVEDPTRFLNNENADKLINALSGSKNLDRDLLKMSSTIEEANPELIKALNGLAERLTESNNNSEIAIRFKVEGSQIMMEAIGPDGKVMAKETTIY